MKILYVEDNPRDADLAMRQLLKAAPHFQIEAVTTLGEASARLERLATEPLDLVLTDVRLPDGDGLTLLKQIRDRALSLAVVVITGTGDEETAVAALKAGADDYVSKRKDYLDRLPLTLENALHHYQASAVRRLRPLRVLYAEHDPKDIDITRRHFSKRAGHIHLDVVFTGPEALERLQAKNGRDDYDVLLLDYRLPGLDALELLKELRLIQKLDIPVVLVTGQGSEEVALQAIKFGALSYVVKNPGYLFQLPGELENARFRVELIRREEELRESEGRLRLAQQAARVGTWEWDVRTGESVWSEMIWELVGLEPGDGATTVERFIEFIHPEDRDRVLRKVREVIAEGEEYYDEFRLVRRDGEVLWVSSKGRVIRSADGQPERMLGVNIDITQRKLAEDARRESEERNRATLNAIPDLMFLQTRDGVYLDYHAKDPDSLLVPPEQFLGKKMEDVLPAELSAELSHCFARALETGDTQVHEYSLKLSGESRWFEARIARCNGEKLLSVVRDITERKRAEEALKESENQVRLFVEHTPAAVAMFDREMRYLLASRRWLKDNNLSDEDIIGRSHYEVVPEVPERWREGHRRCLAGAVERSEEDIFPHADGTMDWVRWETRPWYAASGEIGGLIMFSEMITERKRAQEAQSFQAHLLNTIEQAVIATDLNGAVIFWNQFAERLYGWAMDEAMGREVKDLISYEVSHDPAEEIWSQLRKGQSWAGEFKLRHRDGTTLQIWVNNSPIYDDRGNMIGVIGVSHDITERKRAEEALKESEKRFRMMADATPIMVWLSGTDKLCTYFNKGWLDFTGRTIEEERGEGWCEGIHSEDLDRCLETYNKSFNARLPFTMEYRLRRHDGEYRWVLDTGVPHFSTSGTFLGYIGSALDITERKQSEVDLLRLTARLFNLQDEERRRIARELHDETAQNLFAISINLTKLHQHSSAWGEDEKRVLEECQALCEQSLQEIRTLSYLLHPPLLDQAGLVSALQWYVEGFIKRSGIYVDLLVFQDIGRLPSEIEMALFRIVQESLTNIRRHSGSSTASIRLEKKPDEIVLQIKDQGSGMRTHELSEPEDEISELGVGIPGMRQRLRQLGGRLEVGSSEQGTTITASVPLV
jgi:PAS domain S-box-containing protein